MQAVNRKDNQLIKGKNCRPSILKNTGSHKIFTNNLKSLSLLPRIKAQNNSIMISQISNKIIKKHKKCLTQASPLIKQGNCLINEQIFNHKKHLKLEDNNLNIQFQQNKTVKNRSGIQQFQQIIQIYASLWNQVSESNRNQIKREISLFFKRLYYTQVLQNIWKESVKQLQNIKMYFTHQKIKNLLSKHPNLLQEMTKIGNMMLHIISSNKKNRWLQLKDKIRKVQQQKNKTILDIADNLKKTSINTRHKIVKSIESIDCNLKAENIRYESWMESAILHFRQNGVKCELLKRQIYNYY